MKWFRPTVFAIIVLAVVAFGVASAEPVRLTVPGAYVRALDVALSKCYTSGARRTYPYEKVDVEIRETPETFEIDFLLKPGPPTGWIHGGLECVVDKKTYRFISRGVLG